jgi:hypothetical protein
MNKFINYLFLLFHLHFNDDMHVLALSNAVKPDIYNDVFIETP